MKRSNDENMTAFGKALWALRKEKKLRQEDLAKALGVSRDIISYYESKSKNPTMDFVIKVAEYFNVSIDFLLKDKTSLSKPGPASKLERQLELVRKLPKDKQKAISTVLDMALQNVNA